MGAMRKPAENPVVARLIAMNGAGECGATKLRDAGLDHGVANHWMHLPLRSFGISAYAGELNSRSQTLICRERCRWGEQVFSGAASRTCLKTNASMPAHKR